MANDAAADLAHRALFGLGELDWDEAVKEAASSLRDDGIVEYQRLRTNGKVYVAVDEAIKEGLEYGWFDQPEAGVVRAILSDPKDYSPHHWYLPICAHLMGKLPMRENELVREAAVSAKARNGLVFDRVSPGGMIDNKIREAIKSLLETGLLQRTADGMIVYRNSDDEDDRSGGRGPGQA